MHATESRRRPRPRSRAEAAALLALYGLLLVVPSADYQHFDGLPASRLVEFLGLVLLVPFAASGVLRRAYARLVGAMWPAACGGLLALGVVALAVKIVLLASGTHAGFFACYRSPVATPPAGPCEKSYENPLTRFGITRLDRRLDFTPLTWDLSFFNSNRFNIYPWINSYYGGRLVLMTTSAGIPENLVIPPARLADLARDAEVRSRLRTQLARMLYLVDAPDRLFEVAVRGLQVLWVGAVGAWAITRRPHASVALLLAVPACYLVPHVFYQATHGYPRHFLAGYVAMGAMVLLVAERWWRAAPRTPARGGVADEFR